MLAWPDLAGKRVGVWGFGREGTASLRKLRAMGVESVLVDDNPPAKADTAAGAGAEDILATADGGLDALLKCDVVIKTPGISRYRPEADRLRDAGVVLTGGLALWLAGQAAAGDLNRVVVVTGTKGKSTTSSVIGHLLNGLGHRAAVGGNIGNVPYDPDTEPGGPPGAPRGGHGGARSSPVRRGGLGGIFPPRQYWIIEVSSYQATDLGVTPPVTAVTSLHPDHLPWHGGVEQYYRDKLSACGQPGAELTIANGDSEEIRERTPLLGPAVRWVGEDDEPGATWMEPLGLPGRHNRRNALIARQVLLGLGVEGADDDARLAAAAAGYVGLPSRLATIGTVTAGGAPVASGTAAGPGAGPGAGVRFVDDSLSTNVLPTLAALDAFPGQRVALIVGGQDRGIDYGELADGVMARADETAVLTLPDSGPRISAAFRERAGARGAPGGPRAPGTASAVPVQDCPDLDTAVRAGFTWAKPDGVVLLSPAAPSFGHFKNYSDRAAAFSRAMREISQE
jgi:UDP-N-acetylmuramoylalanine--D-glutamate ligase